MMSSKLLLLQIATKHSDKTFISMEARFFVLKGYITCEISVLNTNVDLFIEKLKEAIAKTEKRDNNIEILRGNINFL